jgi:hypothetical protein
MESSPEMITRKELDESLERVLAVNKKEMDGVRIDVNTSIDSVRIGMNASIDRVRTDMNTSIDRLRIDMDASLERVMNNVLFELKMFRDQTDARFRGIEARLDRQAGLIQSGARAMLRFDRWADTADQRLMEMGDHIQSLEARVTQIENRP